jgi:hypothetical protein
VARRSDLVSPAPGRMINRFGGMVWRVAMRHDLPESDVDELIQDVRIRIWRAHADGEKIAGAPASQSAPDA